MDVSNCAAASDGLPNHTNDPLPDGQKREIQARISAELEDIRVIEEEIQDLRLRHKVKTDRVASLKIFVSPMKEFPHEVIARIFEQYAHGPYPDPDGGRRNPPWYLGHICSRWRTVAWATPNLWNFFVFDARNFKEGSLNHRSLDIAKYLLVRTGQSPISCIFLRPHSHPFSATRFFDLFSDHVGRLRSLKIDHINGIRSLYSIPQYPLTSLKFLDLRFDSIGQTSPHDVGPETSTTLFNNTPLLRDVSISAEYYHPENSDLLSLRLPWNQLTHLDISQFGLSTSSTIYVLLLLCPNLIVFSVFIIFSSGTSDDYSIALPTIELQHLESLIIRGDNQFLEYLHLPFLKCLSINSSLFDSVADLFKRSGCQIETLKVGGYKGDKRAGWKSPILVLKETPSLRHLAVACDDSLLTVIQHMVNNRETFLPSLRLIQSPTADLRFTQKNIGYIQEGLSGPTQNQQFPVRMVVVGDDSGGTVDLGLLQGGRLTVELREVGSMGIDRYLLHGFSLSRGPAPRTQFW